jgi:hypothetical protein
MFPWGEVALQVVVLVCLGPFLMNRSQEVDTKYAAVRSETLGRHWLASRSDQQLAKEKQELEQRVESMRKFLATRIVWSAYAHDLPAQLPVNATGLAPLIVMHAATVTLVAPTTSDSTTGTPVNSVQILSVNKSFSGEDVSATVSLTAVPN